MATVNLLNFKVVLENCSPARDHETQCSLWRWVQWPCDLCQKGREESLLFMPICQKLGSARKQRDLLGDVQHWANDVCDIDERTHPMSCFLFLSISVGCLDETQALFFSMAAREKMLVGHAKSRLNRVGCTENRSGRTQTLLCCCIAASGNEITHEKPLD